MILGIGVDTVEVHRFIHWHTYTEKKLLRIFSQEEIEYCLQQPHKSAERFAVRLAAREAFFKAFCSAYPDMYIPFLTICRFVSIQKQDNGRPVLWVDWKNIMKKHNIPVVCHVSLTHTNEMATAFVVIEQKKELNL